MRIRKAYVKDVNEIYDVLQTMLVSEDKASARVGKEFLRIRKRLPRFSLHAKRELLREIREKNAMFLVAVEQGHIRGYARGAVINTKDAFFSKSIKGYFHALCVKPEFQGRGIGRRLLQALESWFKAQGCVMVLGEVFATNPAVKLYAHQGYKILNHVIAKKL